VNVGREQKASQTKMFWFVSTKNGNVRIHVIHVNLGVF